MSEQPQPQEQQLKWGDDISPERTTELDGQLRAWEQETDHGERIGPFDKTGWTGRLTGADVFYLAARAATRSEGDVAEAAERLRTAWGLDRYQFNLSALHLEQADLSRANLTGADLSRANLTRADLSRANLTEAYLRFATLAGASLYGANLTGANLYEANLTGSDLTGATLERATLYSATLTGGANLGGATLTGANLFQANLTGAYLVSATLTGATVASANLTRATVASTNLTGANLIGATLARTSLFQANLTGADLNFATLTGANLQSSRMDPATNLANITLDKHTKLGDVVWNGAPLTRVDWSRAPTFGDEEAITAAKTRKDRIKAIHDASRAYRGLTTALRSQSMAREASRYRLCEQRLEQRAQRLEHHFGAWLFSSILDLISGYGEAPGRIFAAYLVVVLSFAAAYFGITNFGGTVLTSGSQPLHWYEAIVLSLSSFHGRGFFPQAISLGDPVAVVAALEAVTGLFIELTLIATFSKRFLAS